MSNIAIIDLNQKLSELSIIDFMELIPMSRICVHFNGQPLGSVSNLTIRGVQFQLLKACEVVDLNVGADPNLRRYLQVSGANTIKIELPTLASRIDVFAGENGAGGQVTGTIINNNGNLVDMWTEGSEHVIHTHTTYGANLKTVLIAITSDAEGLIWGVCYVPQ